MLNLSTQTKKHAKKTTTCVQSEQKIAAMIKQIKTVFIQYRYVLANFALRTKAQAFERRFLKKFHTQQDQLHDAAGESGEDFKEAERHCTHEMQFDALTTHSRRAQGEHGQQKSR